MRIMRFVAGVLLVTGLTIVIPGEFSPTRCEDPAPAPPKQAPCSSEEYRQFDFWVGDWDVSSVGRDGKLRKSHNRISRIQSGCAVLEEYDTPTGYSGISINYYDASTSRWVQTWIDNQGQPIVHSGGVEDGSMVLRDEPAEGRPRNRTTWTPGPGGTVRQHWEQSKDGDQTWTTVFDGTYTRR